VIRVLSRLAILVLALAFRPSVLDAQVATVNSLTFGTIVAGTGRSVGAASASSAQWRIGSVLGFGAGFDLTLPATLDRVGGGATLPITFCSTCAIYRLNNSNPSGGVVFNPHNTISFGLLPLSTIYVWLGASVSPPVSQPSGSYVGTVVLTYTGVL